MSLIVQKYGGSSLATPRHIRRAAQRIKAVKDAGEEIVVVVSAMGRTTDHLLTLAKRTVQNPPQRELDMLVTVGERISMSLLAMSLHEEGVPAISFTGSQSGIITTNDHTDARIVEIRAHRIREALTKGKAVIIAGFQGVSLEKEITTLGRGGSDTTAVALAAALGAQRCEILTDVDGLFSADPRIVPTARLLPACSYDEALELAHLGAKMQSRSIELAKRFGVEVSIASSQRHDTPGTRIGKEITMEKTSIRGIATKDGFRLLRVAGELAPLAKELAGRKVPLRFFAYGKGEVTFLVDEEKAPSVKGLAGISAEVPKVSIVSAVGDGLSASSDVLPKFLELLGASGAETYLVCANSLSVTAAIPTAAKEKVAKVMHAEFIEKEQP